MSTDERTLIQGNFVPDGHGVPSGNGWSWITAGWNLFTKTPWLWIGVTVVLLIGSIVLSHIPFGQLAVTLFGPVFAGGIVSVSRSLDQGGNVEFGDFFAGFRSHTGSLIGVGVISLVLSAIVVVGVFALMGVSALGALLRGDADPQMMMSMAVTLILSGLLIAALLLPLAMATWFAAPLVMFHDMAPLDAMKASFKGCLKNMLPFLLYGIVLFFAMILASIPFGLGLLVLGPVVAASVYTAYRDIYFTV